MSFFPWGIILGDYQNEKKGRKQRDFRNGNK